MSIQSNYVFIHAGPDGLPSQDLFGQHGKGLRPRMDRIGAIFGLVGSAMGCILGMLFLGIGYFLGAPDLARPFNLIGSALLCSVIPLLLLGAAFLDRLEDDLEAAETHSAPKTALSTRREGEPARVQREARAS